MEASTVEQLPGERGAARLLAVGGVAAALGLVAHEPGVLTAAHGVGLLLSLGLAVLALRRGLAAMVPMHVAMLIGRDAAGRRRGGAVGRRAAARGADRAAASSRPGSRRRRGARRSAGRWRSRSS
jgi:hypothetical protein